MLTKSAEKKATKHGKGSIIGGIILLLIAGIIFAITYYVGGQSRASQTWPTAEGVIVESYITKYSGASRRTSFKPIIVFQYRVDGKLYARQDVKFGLIASYGTQNGARKVLADYPLGKQVVVYYDPAKPTVAVVDRSVSQVWQWVLYFVSAVFAFFGVALIYAVFRSNVSGVDAGAEPR